MIVGELFLKLSIAGLLGFLIGIDRQLKHKPLGLKTSIVICVASCLMTIVSVESFYRFATPLYNNIDPMRLAAQIVSGVGFLGAGVILRRSNDVISGLTTAAMIWAASGLGIAVGAGFYYEAFFAVALLMLALNFLPLFVKKIGPSSLSKKDVSVKIVMEQNTQMTELLKDMEKKGSNMKEKRYEEMKIRNMKIKDLDNGYQQIHLTMSVPENRYTTEIYYYIKSKNHVLKVEVENL